MIKVGGFPPRRAPLQTKTESAPPPAATVPVESIQYDDEGRRIMTAPLVPAPRPPATVAVPPRPGAFLASKGSPPPRPANMPQRGAPAPKTPFRAPPRPLAVGPKDRPMAFRNGVALDVTPEDIPY